MLLHPIRGLDVVGVFVKILDEGTVVLFTVISKAVAEGVVTGEMIGLAASVISRS